MQKKVLVLGNNSKDTDHRVSDLAQQTGSSNLGLVVDAGFQPRAPGFYHSSVADLPWGALIELAQRFDEIIMLDQPRDQWSHWKCLLGTFKIMCHLEEIGKNTKFRHNKNTQSFQYWRRLQDENRSFCLYPWIVKFIRYDNLMPCARSNEPITGLKDFQGWRDDPRFQEIRTKMLVGETLPKTCRVCYYYEDNNIESYRQFETLDWVAKIGLDSVEDLHSIDQPYYYEMHTGNRCNIKCRGCSPTYSDQIGKEFRKFNIQPLDNTPPLPSTFSVIEQIDIDQLTPRHRVYFQGGEPTIMPEVLEFMHRCLDRGRTDFDLSICTNGLVLSEKLLEISRHFSMMNFSFSIDGFGRVNDYWRWGSQWDRVIQNAQLVQSMGHNLSINTVPGIYNVTNLHLLFEFLDQHFPDTSVYLQLNYVRSQSAFNFPDPDLVLASMERCRQTRIYHSDGKSCKTCIDSIYDHYSKNPQCDLEDLAEFFRFNDQLDRVRDSRLADYIPELEQCRRYLR